MKLTPVTPGRRFYDLFRTQGKLVSETLTELSKSLLEGKAGTRDCAILSTSATRRRIRFITWSTVHS